MAISATAVLAFLVLFGVLGYFGVSLVRGPSDVILVFVLVESLFYGLRPLLFVLGLDGPTPAAYFDRAELSSVLTTTLLGITLFLLMTLLATWAVLRSGMRGWAPFFATGHVSLSRLLRITLAFTVVATLISGWLITTYGGFGGLVTAAKVDKALAGMFVLRVAPGVGAILAVTTCLEAYAVRAARRVVVAGLLCAVLNATYVFLWGSRSVLVVIGAAIVLGLRRRTRRPARRPTVKRPVAIRLVAATLLVVTVAGGMRLVRDTLINGEVQQVYSQASVWRQVSLGTNAVYFDASMLAFRDWPAEHSFRNGEDYKVGVLGLVPRKVWADKPTDVVPGKWFRQEYQPEKENGWPMGAAGLAYLNFGWLGLAVGGLVTGLALGTVAAAQRRSPDNGFNAGVAMATGVFVISLGVDNDTLVRCVIWLVPLYVAARYVTKSDNSVTGSPKRTGITTPAAYSEGTRVP